MAMRLRFSTKKYGGELFEGTIVSVRGGKCGGVFFEMSMGIL
jgi:hypothetical protein